MEKSTQATEQYQGWVEQYSADLYRFAYRISGRADLAEDLVQETFYHAWRSQSSLKDHNKARAWLYQILRFRYAHWARTQSRRPRTSPIDEQIAQTTRDNTPDPLQKMAEAEDLQQALDKLDDRFREVFLMVFSQGLSCQETADELNIPLGTVLSRIHRARKVLRQTLETKSSLDKPDKKTNRRDDELPRFKLGG